jgi:hypothetical protein
MDAETTTRVFTLAAQVAAGVAELEARAVGQAQDLDLPGQAGCKSTTRWLQNTTHATYTTAKAKVDLTKALDGAEATRAAIATGAVHAEQAVAIGTHLDRLDPDGWEAREAALLEAQEERARARTSFSVRDDGQGMSHGRFSVPTLAGAMLRKQLQALAAPKHVRATQGAGAYEHEIPSHPPSTGRRSSSGSNASTPSTSARSAPQRDRDRDRRLRPAGREGQGGVSRHRREALPDRVPPPRL